MYLLHVPDIVHVHMYLLHVPDIVHVHMYLLHVPDIVHVHVPTNVSSIIITSLKPLI